LPPGGGVLDLSAVTTSLTGESTRLVAGTWTGIFSSDDGGQHWQNIAPALGNPNAQTLLATKTGLMLGTRSGLYLWQPESDQWISVSAGLPSGVSSLAADPHGDEAYFAGTQAHGVFRSSNVEQGWEPVPALIAGIPAVTVDPKDPQHIYLLAAWERVYESRDGGQTWDARWDGLGNIIETTALAVDPLKPIAYVGTEAGLYRSENGQAWNLALPALADQTILALYARPNAYNQTELYIGSTRGLSRSLDNGTTLKGSTQHPGGWGQGLENVSVTAILVDPTSTEHLYAGTAYQGVYASVDGGVTWQSIGAPELEKGVVEALGWGPEQALFVVTTDGVWQGNREK
jgi:ligand-binding sensor domain-containing protein